MNVNAEIVTEYVKLCECLTALDAAAEQRYYARLDQLWYSEMTVIDRAEAERRLNAPNAKRHDDRLCDASEVDSK